MLYRRFGKTEMDVSIFTLGLMRYQDAGRDEAARIVQRAVELGINHLETARGYAESEELLGYALPGIDRDKVYITTKFRSNGSYDDFMRRFDEAMAKMGIDVLDNLDLHGVNNEESYENLVRSKETWRAIDKLRDAGSLKHVGFSTHGKLPLVMEALNTQLFESVNLHYYWFFQALEPLVQRATELDMGVFIISPNEKGGMLFKPTEKLRALSGPYHPMNLAQRWLISDHRVHTLSLGIGHIEEYESHMVVADNDAPLSDEERRLLAGWDRAMRDAVGRDYCTCCQQCLPCPERIDIPEILRWRNMTVGLDMNEFGSFRYDLLDGTEDWFFGPTADRCTECGDCLPRCPEKLEIPRLLFDTHDRLKTGQGYRLWG